jgi:hypothetical protein
MELDEGGKYLREIMVGKPEHAIGEQRQIERSEFDRWFDLVTDSSHVSSEVDNFKNAWLSAVDHTDIDIFNIRKLDALLRLQKLFLWEEITSGFNRDEVAQNPAQYLAMAVKYRQAEKENSTRRKAQNESSARRMASRAAHLAQDASNLNYAADIMEEAFEKGSVLKNEFQDKVKLWRRGISK